MKQLRRMTAPTKIELEGDAMVLRAVSELAGNR